MKRSKNDNWRFTIKFAEDDPIAHYTYTSSGIPSGMEEFWNFDKSVGNTRKLMGIIIERIVKSPNSKSVVGKKE